MRASPAICASFLLATALATTTRLAGADGTPLRADLVEPKAIKLDGIVKEWPQGTVPLSYTTKGTAGKPDLEARGVVAYDASNVYVAVEVTDDKLRPGGDYVALVIGFPGGTTYEVKLFPGDPGKSPGVAKGPDGRAIAGAKVVEAPHQGGWSLEASVPWSVMPQARTVRVGMRGALFVNDADDSNTIESVVGSGPSMSYSGLPALVTEPEQALGDGLLHDKGISSAPKFNLLADIVGDSMKERVLVYDRFLVILGPTFRGGSEYYWNDMGVDVANGMLPSLELKDVTGDGQAELVFRKRFGTLGRWREILQVQSFGSGDVPNTIFQHEIGLSSEIGSVTNEVRFVPDAGKTAIVIETGAAKGYTSANYREATETTMEPLLLPWGSVKSQTFKFQGGSFTKASEEKQTPKGAPAAAAAAAGAPAPPMAAPKPAGPSPAELQDKVYDLYKKDRGASGRPRFDLAADIAGDKQNERILLHDRDLVVFGKGFRGGTSYSFLSLSMFASTSDITEVTTRDLTGDGKVEILVRGVLHASAQKDGGGTVDREVILVFQMVGEGMKRVFAAELARAQGKKRVGGSIKFVPAGKSMEIELSPDKAVEWTEKTYPFNQDTSPVGGFEPLLLPWGGNRPVRYRWNGTAFAR